MVRVSILFALLAGLAGCALTPYPTSGDEHQITVFQPYIGQFDRDKAMHLADEHCKKFGKHARLKSNQGKKILFVCN